MCSDCMPASTHKSQISCKLLSYITTHCKIKCMKQALNKGVGAENERVQKRACKHKTGSSLSQHQQQQQRAELGHLRQMTVVTGTAQTAHTNPHTAEENCITQTGCRAQCVKPGVLLPAINRLNGKSIHLHFTPSCSTRAVSVSKSQGAWYWAAPRRGCVF